MRKEQLLSSPDNVEIAQQKVDFYKNEIVRLLQSTNREYVLVYEQTRKPVLAKRLYLYSNGRWRLGIGAPDSSMNNEISTSRIGLKFASLTDSDIQDAEKNKISRSVDIAIAFHNKSEECPNILEATFFIDKGIELVDRIKKFYDDAIASYYKRYEHLYLEHLAEQLQSVLAQLNN